MSGLTVESIIAAVAARSVNPMLFLAGMAMAYSTGLLLLLAAAAKFLEHARHPEPLIKSKRHFFSTREMLVAVLVLFPFWLNSFGQLPLAAPLQPLFFAAGLLATLAATAWHVWAKRAIRHMWSDGIEIKREHRLVTSGPYGLARHPMYASLLLWCWGVGMMLFNGATLVLTTAILLPLMIRRARDEERALGEAEPDYLFYARNVPMLTPGLAGRTAMAFRLLALVLFAACVVLGLDWAGVVLLSALHLYLGFCLTVPKVAFSYRAKAGLMLAFFAGAALWAPVYYLFYLMGLSFLLGLRVNCPCMALYERYHGCPCLGWAKRCVTGKK